MDEREIEELQRRLRKRGFALDATRDYCDACTARAQHVYKLLNARLGGRDIRWCLACGTARSWRRAPDDGLVEEPAFDLRAFLT